MQELFLKIFNMSISAGWVIAAVMLIRLALKKAPKRAVIFLWAIVAVRLVCPFSPESVLSLIPSAETVPADIVYSETPAIQSGVPVIDGVANPVISNNLKPEISGSVNPAQTAVSAAAALWLAGVLAMIVYALVSVLKIRSRVREAVKYRDNIWLCDRISTPFIFGVFRPSVYLPFSLPENETEYVIAHEKAHLKRHDHIIKPFAFLLLCVYWFNPFLWVAYILFCRDIELACDETVIKTMDTEEIKKYTSALLECSVPARRISPCPLAFGETGVKSRIKAALNYKKPAVWAAGTVVVIIAVAAVIFLTSPIKNDFSPDSHEWTFRCVQDGENGAILYCSESESEIYPDAEICDYFVTVKKDSFILQSSAESGDEGNLYSYECVSRTRGGNIYEISGNGEKGYMSVGKTEYYGGDYEYTLIITVGDQSFYFYSSNSEHKPLYNKMSGTDCIDIEYFSQKVNLNDQSPYITAKWINNSNDWLCFGDEFRLYRNGGECEIKEGYGWNDVLYTLDKNGTYTENYYLNAYDISADGNYRLEKEFYFEDNPDKKYTAYIEFEISGNQ